MKHSLPILLVLVLSCLCSPLSADEADGRISAVTIVLPENDHFSRAVNTTSASAKGLLGRDNDEYLGLSVFVDAGLLIPNAKQAEFYSGRDQNPNTINRVLKSDSYGREIWQNLKNQRLISDAVGSYANFMIDEYPSMYYKLTYQLGLGIRYSYSHGWGWLLRFDYSQLTAAGAWNLSATNGTGIISDRGRYIRCGMYGVERRIFIDLALTKKFPLGGNLSTEANLGLNVNNTKVKDHKMEIGGEYYSILDVWNGQSPNTGVGTYEYINQGGIGYGAFATVALSYSVKGYGSVDLGYSCYYTKTRFPGFNDNDAFALQHVIFVRATLSNFSF